MIGLGFLIIVLGVFFIDHRLQKLVKIQQALLDVERKSLDQQRENAKALQWIVDQSKK